MAELIKKAFFRELCRTLLVNNIHLLNDCVSGKSGDRIILFIMTNQFFKRISSLAEKCERLLASRCSVGINCLELITYAKDRVADRLGCQSQIELSFADLEVLLIKICSHGFQELIEHSACIHTAKLLTLLKDRKIVCRTLAVFECISVHLTIKRQEILSNRLISHLAIHHGNTVKLSKNMLAAYVRPVEINHFIEESHCIIFEDHTYILLIMYEFFVR